MANHTKVQYCPEPTAVNLAAIRGKVVVLIRGGLVGGRQLVVTTNDEKSAEAVVAMKIVKAMGAKG